MAPLPPSFPPLPILELLPAFREALADDAPLPRGAVVVAPPGAGKTTVLPLALLEAPWMEGRRVLLLEPRRLAARAAAFRMASLLGESDVGGIVGYRIRLDTRVSARTRIEVVTEGVLTRMLQDDPSLEGVGALLFDEFHERSLHADLGLALALEARDLFSPALRIVVMSATLEGAPVARLLGAPVLESQGRTFPVETRHRASPLPPGRPVEGAVATTILEALAEQEGDLLAFLPGAREIHRTAEALEARGGLPPEVTLHLLYGALPREAQDAVLLPTPSGARKVVLASAVAETSLTLPGVRIVVDAGLMRIPRFDPGSGMTRLETIRVTRDAADQRRGRAGRTAPGVCYRLWTKGEDRGLVAVRAPEIREADLAPLLLETERWGADPEALRWLDPPPGPALAAARDLLGWLGLRRAEGGLTPRGEAVAALGAHPRVGHLLLSARELGVAGTGCELAGVLGDRDLLRGEAGPPDADLRLRLELLRPGRRGASVPGVQVDRGAVARAREEARHWVRRLGVRGDPPREEAMAGVLAALAWPDRVGRHRGGGRYLLAGGRGAILEGAQSLAGSPWLVAVEVEGRGADVRIRQALPVDEAEVETHLAALVVEEERIAWNAEAGRVEAIHVRRLGAVELGRGPLASADPESVAAALAKGVRGAGIDALPWTPATRALRERLAFLHYHDPEGWPDASDEALLATLETWLLPFAPGARSLAELGRVGLTEPLLSRVPWERRGSLDDLAPSHLPVPSGSRVALDYADPEAPVLGARIQELFGMTETPRVAGGRVPVVVHLLSPARRPVQVTRDLASFWREGYFEVRKDLRGRYPRHFWPDDPLNAPATRRVRPGP